MDTLTAGLAAWYSFEENFDQGIFAVNSVPPYVGYSAENPASLALSPKWVSPAYLFPQSATGKIGNCASFDYNTATFILLAAPSAPAFLFNRDKSVSFWIKFRSFNDVNAIFWKSLPTGSPEYCVRVTDITHRLIANESITHSQELLTGQWYFVAITYQHATSTWAIAVDNAASTTGVDAVTSTADLFGIGGNPSFDGLIDEFAIWDRLLLPDEITVLYNSGHGLSYEDITQARPCRATPHCCHAPAFSQ